MKRPATLALLFGMGLLNSACATSENGASGTKSSEPVRILHQDAFCGNYGQSAQIVEVSAATLAEGQLAFLDNAQLITQLSDALGNGPIYWISAGMRPTPGYTLIIKADGVQQSVLQLAVSQSTPDPDRMMAQVVTTPCLFIQTTDPAIVGIDFSGDLPGLPQSVRQGRK